MLDYCNVNDCYSIIGWIFSGLVFGIACVFIWAMIEMKD